MRAFHSLPRRTIALALFATVGLWVPVASAQLDLDGPPSTPEGRRVNPRMGDSVGPGVFVGTNWVELSLLAGWLTRQYWVPEYGRWQYWNPAEGYWQSQPYDPSDPGMVGRGDLTAFGGSPDESQQVRDNQATGQREYYNYETTSWQSTPYTPSGNPPPVIDVVLPPGVNSLGESFEEGGQPFIELGDFSENLSRPSVPLSLPYLFRNTLPPRTGAAPRQGTANVSGGSGVFVGTDWVELSLLAGWLTRQYWVPEYGQWQYWNPAEGYWQSQPYDPSDPGMVGRGDKTAFGGSPDERQQVRDNQATGQREYYNYETTSWQSTPYTPSGNPPPIIDVGLPPGVNSLGESFEEGGQPFIELEGFSENLSRPSVPLSLPYLFRNTLPPRMGAARRQGTANVSGGAGVFVGTDWVELSLLAGWLTRQYWVPEYGQWQYWNPAEGYWQSQPYDPSDPGMVGRGDKTAFGGSPDESQQVRENQATGQREYYNYETTSWQSTPYTPSGNPPPIIDVVLPPGVNSLGESFEEGGQPFIELGDFSENLSRPSVPLSPTEPRPRSLRTPVSQNAGISFSENYSVLLDADTKIEIPPGFDSLVDSFEEERQPIEFGDFGNLDGGLGQRPDFRPFATGRFPTPFARRGVDRDPFARNGISRISLGAAPSGLPPGGGGGVDLGGAVGRN